jgi:eukaryotic-like serine/threonine-protein kinase
MSRRASSTSSSSRSCPPLNPAANSVTLRGGVSSANASGSALIGEVVGGYVLESILGQGGMGCVYLASHTRLGRKAAIKVLAPHFASDQLYVSRFFHEAKVVNEVHHPNIIEVIDFIEQVSPRRVAYVMELLRGEPLSAVLKRRPLSLVQAVNASFQLATALEAVHALGVVHRDLKPDNIFIIASLESDLGQVPSVKILDFGVAKIATKTGAPMTAEGTILGTPMYMAPEQISTSPVSSGTDVYALGELFYEMLTGKHAFDTEDVSIVVKRKVMGEMPDLPIPNDVPVPNKIRNLVRDCLATKPEDRPVMSAVQQRLLDLLEYVDTPMIIPSAPTIPAKREPPSDALATTIEAGPPKISQATVSPSMDRPRSRSKRTLVVPFGVVVLGLVAWVALRDAPEPLPAMPPAKAAIPAAVPEEPEIAAAPEPVKRVRLTTTPEGAEIFDLETRALLGSAPLELDLASEKRRVEVRRAGYDHRVVELDATKPLVEVTLTKKLQKPAVSEKAAPPTPQPESGTSGAKRKYLPKNETTSW